MDWIILDEAAVTAHLPSDLAVENEKLKRLVGELTLELNNGGSHR